MTLVLKCFAWTLFALFLIAIVIPFTYGTYVGAVKVFNELQTQTTPVVKGCRDA